MVYKTDLRIGNYLSLGSITSTSTTTSVGKVFELRDSVVVLKMNSSKLENLDYEWAIPILLTDEIIKKCGFEQVEPIVLLYKSPLHLMKSGDGWQMQQNQGNIGTRILHYLHELQNLYYALSGDEIVIKEFE